MADYLQADGSTLLEITRAELGPGERVFGRHRVQLTLHFMRHAAEPSAAWEVFPVGADVVLVNPAATTTRLGSLGYFHADSSDVRSTPHASTGQVGFFCDFDLRQLEAVEAVRDGRDLVFQVAPRWRVYRSGRPTTGSMNGGSPFTVPRSTWVGLLGAIGYCEYVSLEVPISRDGTGDEVRRALELLREGLENQQRGDHQDAVLCCRNAIEALGAHGFGGHAPTEVLEFIRRSANRLTLAERVAAFKAALQQFCHPAAHGEKGFGRLDSSFALACTAALLRVAPTRLGAPDDGAVAPTNVSP
jgi:hypothetical protein